MAPRERAHARIGPSSLARALNCAGSVNFIDALDDDDGAGPIADEGTILHSFAEDCLNKNLDPFDLVGEERVYNGYPYELTEDDADGILDGLDIIDDIPGKLLVEKRVDLGRWMPEQFGTSDVGIIGKKRITVFDWKFGYKPVSPVENPQAMAYALGFWDTYARDSDVTDFRLIIHQPRVPGGGGVWDTDLDTLLDFGKKLKHLSKEAADPNAPRCAGDWCDSSYCPGVKNRICPEYDKFNLDMIVRDFDELDDAIEHDMPMRMTPLGLLTPERRTFLFKHTSMITKYLERLKSEILDDAIKGRPTPGLKAVEGNRPARKWKDAKEAEGTLKRVLPEEEVFNYKIITPTQAEKILSERAYLKLIKHIDMGEKKPTLVPVDDARPAIRNIADEFEEDEDDD